MAESRCSIKNMLAAILAVGNSEQNMSYPPSVYMSQYKTVDSMLRSKLADMYPSEQSVLDILDPYIGRKVIMVKNGYIDLPDEYRNLLGSPQISANEDGCTECQPQVEKITEREFEQLVINAGCKKRPLIILSQSEFAFRTDSTYKAPTVYVPVGYFSGARQIKVCPPDIKAVEVMYVKNEEEIKYAYTMQPDDTFVYNPTGSIDSKWTSAAFPVFFKAMFALYSAYTKDNQAKEWAVYLQQNGLI